MSQTTPSTPLPTYPELLGNWKKLYLTHVRMSLLSIVGKRKQVKLQPLSTAVVFVNVYVTGMMAKPTMNRGKAC